MVVPQPLGRVGDTARQVQRCGFSGLLLTETGRTAYLNAAVASQAAPGLELSTGVAVAFPRSPFVTAAAAWELQEATGGKFRLGLGTQVRTHVVRRYGMPFDRPGPRLRDYVRAVKACFTAFRTGTSSTLPAIRSSKMPDQVGTSSISRPRAANVRRAMSTRSWVCGPATST